MISKAERKPTENQNNLMTRTSSLRCRSIGSVNLKVNKDFIMIVDFLGYY